MKKVKVWGTTIVSVYAIVEVDDNADIEDMTDAASMEISSLTSYAGNGGHDKLIGVSGRNLGVECGGEIEWAANGEQDIEEVG